MNFLNLLIKSVKFLIFPPKCVFCDSLNTDVFCYECKTQIINSFRPHIIKTQQPLVCASGLVYSRLVQNSIKNFKFRNQVNISNILSNFMASTVKSCFKYEKFDYVTYVPMYKDNSKSYNQSEILAKKVSKILQFPFEICLKKTKKNKVQRGLNFQERQLNVKGVYKSVKSLKNKKILLCDDVVTTGATLSECVKELSKSGAKVICVTAAYTEKNNSLNGNSS